MKALVLEEYGRLVYTDVPDPEVGPDEVLVRVRACGICGSDIHGLDGSTGRRRPPLVMGHEAAGVVEAVGAGVAEWRPGARVTFDSTVSCGECRYCREGRINLCDRRRVLGVSCEEYRRDGAFAEYVAVPQRILYRLPDGVSYIQAAMVEALSIAVHAVGRVPVRLNDTAVVLGSGMIGLLILQVARVAGCGTLVAVDVDPDRLRRACALGADVALDARSEDVPARVAEVTGGRGADLVFEAVGVPETVAAAIASVRKGGCLALVGNVTPRVDVPLQAIVTRELTLFGSCASSGEYPACLDLIGRGQLNVDALISAVAPLAEGALWFRRLYEREAGLMKVILTPAAAGEP
ncbi:MAG: galactitol-1-phosphate 5-dehydrogenase [Lentisphaeria bacterium]|nr:galactitol-1-phosphate 5-dehydrogenase [Lentisphaeria bacterium]